jgi:hypothetical protein
MAGGYASHGETYVHPGPILWWAAGGTLVGDSPARLGFLKTIMTEAPFQDLLPAPEIVRGGTALALKEQYYLVRINSRSMVLEPTEIDLAGDGPYQVDLIDPVLMKVYKLGYSRGGVQSFKTVMNPCLFRFVKANGVGQIQVLDNVQSLIAKWIGDPSVTKPPSAVPLDVKPQFYSPEFTIGELLDDPRTKALVDRYLPNIPRKGFARALTLELLAQFFSTGDNAANLLALDEAIRKVPVQQQ